LRSLVFDTFLRKQKHSNRYDFFHPWHHYHAIGLHSKTQRSFFGYPTLACHSSVKRFE